MPPEAELLQFPFLSGTNEAVDPKTLPPGTLTHLSNLAWTKDGLLDKRLGVTGLAKTGGPSAPRRIFTRGNELLMSDGASLYSWSDLTSTWTNVGQLPEVGLTWDTLLDDVGGSMSDDICVLSSGLVVHTWVAGDPTASLATSGGGAVFYEIFDPVTGKRTQPPTGLDSNASCVRIVTNGTDFVIVYDRLSGGTPIRASFNGATPTSLRTDGNHATFTYCPFDVCVIGSNFVLAYEKVTTGALALYSYSFAGPPVQRAANTNFNTEAAVGIRSIAIAGAAGESLYVGWAGKWTNVKVRFGTANPTTLAQVTAPVTIEDAGNTTNRVQNIGICRLDATHCVFAYTVEGPFSPLATYADGCAQSWVISSAGATVSHRQTFGSWLVTKPFVLGSKVYMFMADAAQAGGYFSYGTLSNWPPYSGSNTYLVEAEQTTLSSDPHRFVGLTELLVGGAWVSPGLSTPAVLSATQVLATVPFQADAPKQHYAWRQGVRIITSSIGASLPADTHRSKQLDGDVIISGGVLMSYDGRRPFDYGFPRSALYDSSTAMNGSGGDLAAGAYLYSTVSEFRSNTGLLHRSPAAPIIPLTAVATDKALLAIIPQTQSWKSNVAITSKEAVRVIHAIYRTTVGGDQLHRLTLEPTYSIVTNDPTTSPQAFTDSSKDDGTGATGAGVALNQQNVIYTAGELDDFAPPAFTTVRWHKSRLFGLSGDLRTIWVSKNYLENIGVAPGFHPTQVLVFDEDIVGLETMDDELVVFSASSIWRVRGDGPAADGTGSDYVPTKVQTDVGLNSVRSLVSLPDGIMFESQRGICLLTKSYELDERLGLQVQDTLAAFPVITSATLIHSSNQVRFTCNNSATAPTAGVVLVWDHVRKQWSTFTYYDTDAAVAGCPIVDATIWNNTWVFVTPAGKVWKEAANHLDDTHWVTGDLEIAWISQDGPLGYQRVRRAYVIGDTFTDVDITMRIGVNHASGYDQTRTWTSLELFNVGSGKVGIHLKTQKSSAMRVRVSDATPTGVGHTAVGSGRGMNFSALGFEILRKPGMDRRPAIARK